MNKMLQPDILISFVLISFFSNITLGLFRGPAALLARCLGLIPLKRGEEFFSD